MMTTLQEAVQAQFGAVAVNYASSAVHAQGEDLALMVQAANLRGGEVVLDAGCGAGHTALAFAPHVTRVVAYDLTPTMLAQVERLAAERGVTNIETRQGDVQRLPFDDASFDLVVSRYSAHHWHNPSAALGEFARVLKRGGAFILSDIVSDDDPLLDTWLQAIELVRDPSHVRDHSVSQWQTMMTAAGFSTQVLYEWLLPLEFGAWVQRIGTPAPQVTTLRALFDAAPREVRGWMAIQRDYAFSIPGALMVGRKV